MPEGRVRPWVKKKLVIPIAAMLSTVPAMIWSPRRPTEMPARTAPMSMPTATPARTPMSRSPVAEATMKPAQADMSIWPSMPMLITPERSPSIPQRAPRTSGVEWRRVLARMAVVWAWWNSPVQSVKATSSAPVTSHHRNR